MRHIRSFFILIIFILFITTANNVFATPAGDNIIISEVAYDVTTEPDEEWFELYNPTKNSIDINGWTITDGEGSVNFIVSLVINPGEYKVIAYDGTAFFNLYGFNPDYEYGQAFGDPNLQLANSGDELTLSQGGTDIDFVSWEGHTAGWNVIADDGESIIRGTSIDTDTNADWQSHIVSPTPGTGNLSVIDNAPDITSDGGLATATIHINENSTAVTTVTATDPDAGDTLSYSISGGVDQSLFSINSTTGDLTVSSLDYENPSDDDSDGIYEVTVQVSDGYMQDTQSISVVVDNINDDPSEIFLDGTSADSVAENTVSGTNIAILTSNDDDSGDTHTYTLVVGPGSDDNDKFTISGDNLQLAFTPDFENPTDLGDVAGNNTYSIRIQSDDGNGGFKQQAFIITITDVDDSSHRSNGSGRVSRARLKEIFKKEKPYEVKENVKENNDVPCVFVYSRLIRYGTHGSDVKELQALLNSLGFNTGVVDGWYGPNTFRGIKAFQTAMGILSDGIVGPQTNGKIMMKCSD